MEMDVTGLVLSLGENNTKRAIESLKKQSIQCRDIVIVRDVTPFHKAMNKGIAKVQTPFFIQCDADMVLDPDCIATMLKFVKKDIAVVIAYLSDDILGRVQAVKLFRTECIKQIKYADHVSPDTDYISRMSKLGWNYIFAQRGRRRYAHPREILGAHKPDYTALYTFEKFKLEGSRMRDRGVFQEFVNGMKILNTSPHPMAPIALVGLCQGIFSKSNRDGLKQYRADKDFKILKSYMKSKKTSNDFIMYKKDK
jgi:glycosyltransferase involved in cell wall biosynthesis